MCVCARACAWVYMQGCHFCSVSRVFGVEDGQARVSFDIAGNSVGEVWGDRLCDWRTRPLPAAALARQHWTQKFREVACRRRAPAQPLMRSTCARVSVHIRHASFSVEVLSLRVCRTHGWIGYSVFVRRDIHRGSSQFIFFSRRVPCLYSSV